MEDWFVGMGPWGESTCSKDPQKCYEQCCDKWKYSSYGFYIVRMTNEQKYSWYKDHYFNIDECEVVWDENNVAPTQKQLDFRKNLIFVKPLK